MTKKTYKFLGYQANGKGIRFADVLNDSSTMKVEHSSGFAPGSTRLNPIVVRRGTVTLSDRIKHTTEGCDPCSALYIPRVVSIQFSGHDAASITQGIDNAILAMNAVKADLVRGFLPTTADVVLTTSEG